MSLSMAIGGAGTALQLFGGMYQKRAAKAAAAARAQAMEFNAKVNKRNEEAAGIRADFANLVGEINIGEFREDFERLNAAVGQRYAKSGFRSDTGMAREVQIANAREADEDIQTQRTNIAAQVISLREQGVNQRLQSVLNRQYAQIERQAGAMRGTQAMMNAVTSAAKSSYLLATA